jgi:hypothetical protein
MEAPDARVVGAGASTPLATDRMLWMPVAKP